jgi:hypothetical protein
VDLTHSDDENPLPPAAGLNNNKCFEIRWFQGCEECEVEKVLTSVTEEVWGNSNNMPYGYLAKVLNDSKNYIFVARKKTKVCSLFAFRFSGKQGEDATVMLLWTRNGWRRKGLRTSLMREGINFLADQSHLNAGTSIAKPSRYVFSSQNWTMTEHNIVGIRLKDLRETLEAKGKHAANGDVRDFATAIPNDIIETCRSHKKEKTPRSSYGKRSQEANDGIQEDSKMPALPKKLCVHKLEETNESTTAAASSDTKTVIERLRAMEKDWFPEPQTGKLKQRIVNLEKKIGAKVNSGNFEDRLRHLEDLM